MSTRVAQLSFPPVTLSLLTKQAQQWLRPAVLGAATPSNPPAPCSQLRVLSWTRQHLGTGQSSCNSARRTRGTGSPGCWWHADPSCRGSLLGRTPAADMLTAGLCRGAKRSLAAEHGGWGARLVVGRAGEWPDLQACSLAARASPSRPRGLRPRDPTVPPACLP